MNKDQIGNDAGIIWKRLEGNLSDTEIKKIKKECRLNEHQFYLALGWLARENKVIFHNMDSSTYIFPVE